jgi:hypothetical protein
MSGGYGRGLGIGDLDAGPGRLGFGSGIAL